VCPRETQQEPGAHRASVVIARCASRGQELPREKASRDDKGAEEAVRYFFSTVFSQGTPKRLARLLSFIEEHQRRNEPHGNAKQPSFHYISRLIARGTLSLEEVVSELVVTHIAFDAAFADWKNDQDQVAVIE